jgi:hypothetical protein
MSPLETARDTVRRVALRLGNAELARLSQLPLMTVVDAHKRNFAGGSVKTLEQLYVAAEAWERRQAAGGAVSEADAA